MNGCECAVCSSKLFKNQPAVQKLMDVIDEINDLRGQIKALEAKQAKALELVDKLRASKRCAWESAADLLSAIYTEGEE